MVVGVKGKNAICMNQREEASYGLLGCVALREVVRD